jgi:hypothetical protein
VEFEPSQLALAVLPFSADSSHADWPGEMAALGAYEHSRSSRAGALDRAVSDSAGARDGASSMASVLAAVARPAGDADLKAAVRRQSAAFFTELRYRP